MTEGSGEGAIEGTKEHMREIVKEVSAECRESLNHLKTNKKNEASTERINEIVVDTLPSLSFFYKDLG
jgi:hypothetical protein